MAITRFSKSPLTRVCAAGAGLSMAAMFAIIFVNSVRRYTIGKSFEWGEELPIYMGIYGMMFGVAYAYLEDRHIRFTLVIDLLSERAQQKLFAAVDLVVALCGGLLAWSGYLFVASRGNLESPGLVGRVGDLAEATGQPWMEVFALMGFWQASMIAGGIALCFAALSKFGERRGQFKRRRR